MKTSKAPKQKRTFFYMLLVLCLSIWGYALFRMGGSLYGDEEGIEVAAVAPVSARNPKPALVTARAEVRYDSSFRDPFAPPVALFTLMTKAPGQQNKPPPEPKQPAIAPTPSPLTLSGIVGETALLHDEAGTVHISRAGEHAGNVQILEVRRDHVVIRFEGQSHTLRLTR